MVAAGTGFVGELVLSDSLHVDGKIDGSVESDSEVSIGQSGHFEGQLQAERVMVSGKLIGNVHARRLEIVSGGLVDGDVEVDELVIESGGHFNGSSTIRGTEAPRQLGYASSEETRRPADGASQATGKPAAEDKDSGSRDSGFKDTGTGTDQLPKNTGTIG